VARVASPDPSERSGEKFAEQGFPERNRENFVLPAWFNAARDGGNWRIGESVRDWGFSLGESGVNTLCTSPLGW